MSGSTQRTLTDRWYELTVSTPCIDFAIDPDTGESGEQEYHSREADRFDRIMRDIHEPVSRAIDEVLRTLHLDGEIIPFDGGLVEVYDFRRKAFLAEGDRPCRLPFAIHMPESFFLRLCFRRLPSLEAAEALLRDLRIEFEKRIKT